RGGGRAPRPVKAAPAADEKIVVFSLSAGSRRLCQQGRARERGQPRDRATDDHCSLISPASWCRLRACPRTAGAILMELPCRHGPPAGGARAVHLTSGLLDLS